MSEPYKIYDYDNIPISNFEDNHQNEISKISNTTIRELCNTKYPNLLIFPNKLDIYKDGIADSCIFNINNDYLQTGDLLGFIGINNCQITISSRFSKGDKEDYFLHYMLQKVFNINMLNLQHSASSDNVFDFLAYIFPHYLKRALKQGVYKQYTHKNYNDSNIKGSININTHIKHNIPFAGKIAYNVKEYTTDNNITQLIRHTIEYIRSSYMYSVLKTDIDTEAYVSQICSATPSYNKRALEQILNKNIKTINHPYYTEYRILQKLCIQILQHKRLKYGASDNKIYGLLFSGSWLWEEFLYKTILSECGFNHPLNKAGKGGIYLFQKPDYEENEKYSRCKRYPDYFKDGCILDAKYKHLDKNIIDRNDMHQIISYMYVEKASIGGFIYPKSEEERATTSNATVKLIGNLRGYEGKIFNIGVPIPSNKQQSYMEYYKIMDSILESLRTAINNL